jgi:hypothetical protein
MQVLIKTSAGFGKNKCRFLKDQPLFLSFRPRAAAAPGALGEFDYTSGSGLARFQRPASLFTALIFSAGFPKLLEIAGEV